MAKEEVRIDKFMWATRIFKTRTIATEACKKGRVMIDGVSVKPSRTIKIGEVIQVRKPPVTYSFKVLALAENRMGAKLVPGYLENITPPEQYELLEVVRISGFVNRQKGWDDPRSAMAGKWLSSSNRNMPMTGLTSTSILTKMKIRDIK